MSGGIPTETGGFWAQLGKNFLAGAIKGAGIGASSGFAGGAGTMSDVLYGAAIGGAIGGALGAGKVVLLGANVTANPAYQQGLVEGNDPGLNIDLNKIVLRQGGLLPPAGKAAITLGNTISLGGQVTPAWTVSEVADLLNHELVHVFQWNTWGYVLYAAQYIAWAAEYGYEYHPFETGPYLGRGYVVRPDAF